MILIGENRNNMKAIGYNFVKIHKCANVEMFGFLFVSSDTDAFVNYS